MRNWNCMFWNKGSIDINGGPNFYSAFEHTKVGTQFLLMDLKRRKVYSDPTQHPVPISLLMYWSGSCIQTPCL